MIKETVTRNRFGSDNTCDPDIFPTGVSIIVPTLNEEENIDLLLQRIFHAMLPVGVTFEILVVDGNSGDNTCSRVSAWGATHPVRLVCLESNLGLASAVMAGALEAAYEFVVVMDADLSHPPEKIPALLTPLLETRCDVVIGSRYVDGGATPDWPFIRKLTSKIASIPAFFVY